MGFVLFFQIGPVLIPFLSLMHNLLLNKVSTLHIGIFEFLFLLF